MWVPRVAVARRCGAKLLTAHRGGGPALKLEHEFACVDAISFPHVSRSLCRLMGVLWIRQGQEVLEWERQCTEPPIRSKPELDDQLASALQQTG